MEVSTVFHFVGKYVGWVNFPHNVNHIESFVLDQFMDWIFLELNVVSCFRSHIVWPLHAIVVFVVQDGGRGDVVESVAIVRNTVRETLKVHHLFEEALVAWILASQELREVRSWQPPSHPMGPPFLKTMPLFILQNLRRGRRVPSATSFPTWEPQHVLL